MATAVMVAVTAVTEDPATTAAATTERRPLRSKSPLGGRGRRAGASLQICNASATDGGGRASSAIPVRQVACRPGTPDQEERQAEEPDEDEPVRADLARALKTVLLKYDGLWQRRFPYIMVFHQAPTDGEPHPEAHLHLELYPPYRSRERLKYLAGSEVGASLFANAALPEEKAAELRAVEIRLD
jgi:hypothetical protein